MAALGVLTVGFPLWAADDLGVSRSAGGHLWAAFAFGSLLGALAFSGLQQRITQDQAFFLGMFAFGLVMLAWPLAPSLPVALVLVAVAAVADGPALSATFAVRQKRTPAALQSQVMTTLGGLKIGAFSVGAALAGPLVEALGPRTAIAALAATQLAGTAVGLAMRAQGLRSSMRRVSA
jgi:predicted MFS family arabinose efflux permease